MKKIKIFLLLSILLCFGFVLSSEVHAQSEEPSYPTNVVVFKSDSSRTITPKFTQSGVTLQYSIDNGLTWNNIASSGTTVSSDEIWFRGRATGAKSLYNSNSSTNAWEFSGDTSNKLHVYGDLRYLLCDNLGDNTITFNIDSHCFSHMFNGCTGLTTAPQLPATTLADSCYRSMFYGCTGLTTAPSLPATSLADYCYYYMFRYSTSLTTAPELPARTLADSCYRGMFRDCTSLKISSTQIGAYQYEWRIPTSGTGTTASSWNSYMLSGTGGTFTGEPTINTTYYVENPPVYAKWGEKNKMTDVTILIIGLIIFIIANILGFIYKNNLLTALSGLLWLLPIFLVDNAIIKIFSIIIMLITFLFSFKERDDYYYD